MKHAFCYFALLTAALLVLPTVVALRFLPAPVSAVQVPVDTQQAHITSQTTEQAELQPAEKVELQTAESAAMQDQAKSEQTSQKQEQMQLQPQQQAQAPDVQAAQEPCATESLVVTVQCGEQVMCMPLEEYVYHVTLAEVPASFSPQALRACAVAVRSYALYKLLHSSDAAHAGAQLCTESRHCMAFSASTEQGEETPVLDACEATRGEVVLYQGQLCQTFFFAMSCGYTADCSHVFSAQRPYLVPVRSPETEEIPGFLSTVQMTREELLYALQQNGYCPSDPTAPIVLDRDMQGYVLSFSISDVTLSGTAARLCFGLRSSSFDCEQTGEKITFFVRGYGHGVGLSQQGAELLAREGMAYMQILQHYYTGTTIKRWTGE